MRGFFFIRAYHVRVEIKKRRFYFHSIKHIIEHEKDDICGMYGGGSGIFGGGGAVCAGVGCATLGVGI